MKIAIGIDVHKQLCAAYAVRKDNRGDRTGFLEEFNRRFRRFPSTCEGMKNLEEYLGHEHEVSILIENSSKSHDVYWMLVGLGYDVVVAHAADLYRITKSKAKNDDHDAMELAHYMRRRLNGEDEFQTSFIPTREQMELRSLTRFLVDLKCRVAITKKQIRAYCLMNGEHLVDKHRDLSTMKSIRGLADSGRLQLRLYAQSLNQDMKLIKFTEKVVEQVFDDNRIYEILMSIPGIGNYTAAYLASEIVTIDRFDTKEGFSSYFGVRPSQRDSADSQNNGHISHRGDRISRSLIYQATFVHVNWCRDSYISTKYNRLKNAGKHHRVAVVACANSFLMMIFTLLKENRRFICDPKLLEETRSRANALDLDPDEEIPEEEFAGIE